MVVDSQHSRLLELDIICLGKIISYLNVSTLYSLLLTCRYLNMLAVDTGNWNSDVLRVKLAYCLKQAASGKADMKTKRGHFLSDFLDKCITVSNTLNFTGSRHIQYVWSTSGELAALLSCLITEVNEIEESTGSVGGQAKHTLLTFALANRVTIKMTFSLFDKGANHSSHGIIIFVSSGDDFYIYTDNSAFIHILCAYSCTYQFLNCSLLRFSNSLNAVDQQKTFFTDISVLFEHDIGNDCPQTIVTLLKNMLASMNSNELTINHKSEEQIKKCWWKFSEVLEIANQNRKYILENFKQYLKTKEVKEELNDLISLCTLRFSSKDWMSLKRSISDILVVNCSCRQ